MSSVHWKNAKTKHIVALYLSINIQLRCTLYEVFYTCGFWKAPGMYVYDLVYLLVDWHFVWILISAQSCLRVLVLWVRQYQVVPQVPPRIGKVCVKNRTCSAVKKRPSKTFSGSDVLLRPVVIYHVQLRVGQV